MKCHLHRIPVECLRRPTRLMGCLAAIVIPGTVPGQAQETSFELDTLHVTVESRIPVGGVTRAVEVLTRSQIRSLPIRSVTEALAWSVGVGLEARSGAQADVSLRGSSYEQVVVLVDGVRMSDPQTGHFDLDLAVPLERVDRIEIMRGTASSLYGADAVGGVINIVTRAPGKAAAEATVEGGSFGTLHSGVRLAGGAGRVRVSGGADWSQSDGHRDGTDYDVRQGSLAAHGRVGRATVRADAAWAERSFGADGFYAPFPSWEETATRTGAVRVDLPVAGIALEQRLWRRTHDDDFVLKRADPAYYRNVHASSQTGAGLVGRRALGAHGGLAIGGEWVRESLESSRLGSHREDRSAAYAELAFTPGRLALRLGGRLDHYEAFGSFAAPAASAAIRLTERVRLRGSVGRAFRAPTWTERYYEDPANRGRADLDPEKAWTADVGLDVDVPAGSVLRVTAYRRTATDLIDWARPGGEPVWETRNVKRADFRGIEMRLDRVALGAVRISGGLSLLRVDSQESEGLESKYALRPENRKITLGIQAPLAGIGRLGLHVLHARREAQDAHTRADVRLSFPARRGEVSLDVRNLFDAEYVDVTRSRAPGRAISLGYRVRFGADS